MKKWKDQEAEKALFGDPLRATKAIMKTCDVIDRNGLVSETELRVGLENSPYTSFLRHMVGSKANRFRFYARDKCGKLSFSALLTAVKDFNETKNPEKMPINHHVTHLTLGLFLLGLLGHLKCDVKTALGTNSKGDMKPVDAVVRTLPAKRVRKL